MVLVGADLWRRGERRTALDALLAENVTKVLTLLTPLREDQQLEQAIVFRTLYQHYHRCFVLSDQFPEKYL